MKIEYHKANHEDIEVIYTLSKNLIDTYEDIVNIDYDKVLSWVYRNIETHLHEYVCLHKDGHKIGYYRLFPIDKGMELADFYLFEAFQNQGIGSMVLQKCIDDVDGAIYLYVFKKNVLALALYQRFGFKELEDLGTRFILCRDKMV